jgi:hypothetical protein
MSSKKSQKTGSKKSKSSKKEKEKAVKPEVAVAEPVPFLLYYFCCFCILPKKFRKDKRRIEREKKAEQEAAEDYEAPVEEVEVDLKKVDPKTAAVTKIQAMVRGYQAKEAMKEYWQEAVHEASQHWLQIVRARELAWLERERAIVARKQVKYQYLTLSSLYRLSIIKKVLVAFHHSLCSNTCKTFLRLLWRFSHKHPKRAQLSKGRVPHDSASCSTMFNSIYRQLAHNTGYGEATVLGVCANRSPHRARQRSSAAPLRR